MNGNHDVEMNGVTKTDDDDGVVVLTAGHSSTPSPTSTATTLHIHPPPPLHSLPTSEEAHNTYHPDFMFCGACTQCEDDDEGDAPVQTTPEGRVWTASVDVEVGSDPTSTGALVRTQLMVPTMTTESQSHVVETLLKELSGVHRVTSNILTHMVDVDHGASTTLQEMVEVLQKMGFQGARPPSNNSGSNQLEMPLARSQFHVQGICCTSECPTIQSIVEQLPSVSKIQINITTKNVYVEYDPHVVSAMEIAHSLTKQGFKSRILKDGAVPKQKAPEVGRTTLHMTKALVPNDIPKIQQRLACVQGVKRVGVNLVESVVFCEHDVSKVSAKQLSQHLAETEGSGTTSTSNGEYLNSIAADAMDEITQRTTTALTMARSKFVESTLLISNLSLNHLRVLEKSLRQNYVSSQLRAFYPHVPSKTVKLEHNPELLQANQVCGVLQRYGMEASVAIDGSEENLALPLLEDYESDAVHPKVHGNMIREDHASMHYNVWLSGIFWALSLVSYGGGNYLDYFKYCGLFSVLFGIPPIALKAYRTIRRCQFDANCMMVVAAVGALALGEFDEAASVAFLFAVSEYLEARATERARKALAAIVTLRPDHAHVVHPTTKEVIIVPAEKVPVGSTLSVRTGDKIATDGIVVEGMSAVDESSLTGEAVPVTKKMGDTVAGGSINIGEEALLIQTTTSVEDSAVSRLIRLVEEAQANRSPTEKLVDGFAKKYTPVVILMAGLMCTIPWFWGSDTGRYWTLNGLIIIVIACPCALTISTPVTYAAGLAATAQRGIIVKGGASLEALGSVSKVVLDKTGTLTNGKFVLNKLEAVGQHMSRDEVLGLLALIEAPSSHPLSATLVHAARAEGVSIPRHLTMTSHTVLRGEGVSALVDGTKVYVGNRRLFTRLGMYDSLQYYKTTTEEWSQNGGTVGFIGMEEKGIIGVFCVTDDVRPEARQVVEQLHAGGIDVVMLTGDSEGAAQAVARQVGLSPGNVHAQLLPEDKLHHVGSLILPKNMKRKRCCCCPKKSLVLMCGDGINDAPALAVADVGVAMGEGASLAMEMSDITLMDSNIGKLLYSIKMGKRVVMTIQENIVLSLIAKLMVVGLTFGGYMTLLSAIAADVGVMLIVTLNGMKLLPSGREEILSMDNEGAKAPRDTKRISLNSPSYNAVKQQQQQQSGTSTLELV